VVVAAASTAWAKVRVPALGDEARLRLDPEG
jgi:hypothetical protein